MDPSNPTSEFMEVEHHKNESNLHKRRPSKEEDEQFHSKLEGSHEAAKLRRSSSGERIESFHTPVEFSWSQFWTTFVYENLPPVFVSPFAVLLLERSITRAWHITQHRGLCMVSTKHNSIGFIIFSWVIMYPISDNKSLFLKTILSAPIRRTSSFFSNAHCAITLASLSLAN